MNVLPTSGAVVGSETYRAWKRAYSDAEALAEYVFERWRNDYVLYREIRSVCLDDMFGLVVENA